MNSYRSNRKIALKGLRLLIHYAVPLILLALMAFNFALLVAGDSRVLMFTIGFGIIAFLTLWWQHNSLYFRIFNTSQSALLNCKAIRHRIEDSDWEITRFDEGTLIEVKIPPTMLSFGEQVTILFENNIVYVNSIYFNHSIDVFGRNRKNIKIIGDMLSLQQKNGVGII